MITSLPPGVQKLIEAWGVSADDFIAAFNKAASSSDYIPAQWLTTAMHVLVDLKAKITDPAVLLAGLAVAWGEVQSGHPGYNPNAGGLA